MLAVAESRSATQNAEVLLLATLLNSGAYGVLMMQTFLYHLSFNAKDNVRLRATVYGIYALETIQSVMVGRTVYNIHVLGFLDPLSEDEVHDLWFSVPIIGGLVIFVVQAFYAHRILILGNFVARYKLVAGLVTVLSVLQLTASIVTSVELAHVGLWSRVWGRKTRLPYLFWNASGTMCDVTIACSMSYMLSRTKPTYQNTRILVRRLIRLTVETGVITAFVALLNIVLVVAPREHPQYYQVTSALLSKMYANTIMVILNSRVSLSGNLKWDMVEGMEEDNLGSVTNQLRFAPIQLPRTQSNILED